VETSIVNLVKRIIKTSFRLCGLNIQRINPADNNYAWLLKYNIETVLDIGANTGQFAQMINRILPAATIFSFEPIKQCYINLVENMKGVPRFLAFDYGLGDTDDTLEMHVNDFTPSSSLLPMANLHIQAYPFTAKAHAERVKIRQLDTVARELGFDGNLLIKIDVQGYDDKVIRGGQSTISRAKVLIVETSFQSLYVGQPLFEDIYNMLSSMDFKYMGNLSQMKSPIDGSILQADSIFIKEGNQ
jgi:FkbM family methyltransferase